jgi:KUP system potassium uptake protein
MRIDNDGEGGILALMTLVTRGPLRRPFIVACGLFGAALIYGDGAITPAISVLSALEGLNLVSPVFHSYVLPGSVAILIALFLFQRQGTSRIGGAFGPVMLTWLLVIGALGVWGILRHPAVLWALDPLYGLRFLAHGGMTGFLVLGGVFLCVTGAEALYADMGHFGPKPIRVAWTAIVFPSLLLNYAGQAGIVLAGAPTAGNIFYQLCPGMVRVPLILLATAATIIASQSIITGAFSMTRQAIHLGWLPRLPITQTSARGYGQIYVGSVNWLPDAGHARTRAGLSKLGSPRSGLWHRGVGHDASDVAAAVRCAARSPPLASLGLRRHDGAARSRRRNFLRVQSHQGFCRRICASAACLSVYGAMAIWHAGMDAIARRLKEALEPIGDFVARISASGMARVPGTAVFLTRATEQTPLVLAWYVRHIRSLHEHVVILRIETLPVPWSRPAGRMTIDSLAPGMWRGSARYGFMERPDVPALLREAREKGCDVDLDDVTYFIGHETVIPRAAVKGLPRWIEAPFAFMQRNAAHATDYLQVPHNAVVEIGREVEI